jgi:hypothetical protein
MSKDNLDAELVALSLENIQIDRQDQFSVGSVLDSRFRLFGRRPGDSRRRSRRRHFRESIGRIEGTTSNACDVLAQPEPALVQH